MGENIVDGEMRDDIQTADELLCEAVALNRLDLAKMAVDQKANVNQLLNDYDRLIEVTAAIDQREMAAFLIKHGAEITPKAREIAKELHFDEMVALLDTAIQSRDGHAKTAAKQRNDAENRR